LGRLRLMIVDDDPLVRRGLRAIFELEEDVEIVAEAANGHEAVAGAMATSPDLILMDINMPKLDGIEATRQIKAAMPECRVLALTVRNQEDTLIAAIKSGGSGFLLKDSAPHHLIEVVKKVASGQQYFEASLASSLLSRLLQGRGKGQDKTSTPDLTSREEEVLGLIVRGYSNKEIADELNISPRTVKAHVSNILKKMGVEDRTQAAVKILESRLLPQGGGTNRQY